MRIAAALLFATLAYPAAANPFDIPPERYDETINPTLQQVGSDLRVRQSACAPARCRFVARQVEVEVSSPVGRPATERITIAATFRQGDDEAGQRLLEDTLTMIGATMVAYDPRMAADQRGEILLELGDAALSVGEAHRDSADMHYALSFDDVSGRLEITAAALSAGHG
ncbi:hypothetical protein [Microvirga thermotolerans]|uniref:Uncharacterized protein n=1 Tax=Microvirga thermotolerans TaxID=2651334 RepID=A0A5P9JRP9_9HYPH|nr:hypothetical protein [Microvirga thermotolerans]QFU14739.1 hypothetical protein GDR74_00105 [Microvirga thermotolerans]